MTRVTPLARWALAAGAVAVATVLPVAAPAGAAPSPSTGNDISYPQCPSNFPTVGAFGVVGVDDGIANVANPCLTAEITWASGASGNAASSFSSSPQPRAQLYVNTADPGDVYNGQPIADWPSNNAGGGTDPYGACTTTVVKSGRHKTATLGQNSPACAWQYGWNAASKDAQSFFHNAVSGHGALNQNAGDYPWWLDVETGNTWQSATGGGLAMNDAVLEGMVASLSTLTSAGGAPAAVGIYSTGYQWNQITGGEGTVDANWTSLAHAAAPAPLDGHSDWVPGAINTSGADSTCTADGAFTRTAASPAHVTVAQWVANGVDGDVSC
jgi:hypothetical protein